jgi:sugar/nucleoside kinase (ribokinase family)
MSDSFSDTFSGVFIARLTNGHTIDEAVDVAQQAAVMTLASPKAVSERIQQFRA